MKPIKTPADAYAAYGYLSEGDTSAITEMLHAFEALEERQEPPQRGPNQWDFVKDDRSKFGPEHDYTVKGYIDSYGDACYLIEPVSPAALHWCYAKLPEDNPRYGKHGFIIEKQWWPTIEHQMKRDKLMSRQEFEDAMNEMNNLSTQWDDQYVPVHLRKQAF